MIEIRKVSHKPETVIRPVTNEELFNYEKNKLLQAVQKALQDKAKTPAKGFEGATGKRNKN